MRRGVKRSGLPAWRDARRLARAMLDSWARPLSRWAGAGLLIAAAAAGCGDDDEGAERSPEAGVDAAAEAGADADAAPALAPICVKGPSPAPPAGDAACPAPKPANGDALDDALAQAGVDRCTFGFSDQTMSIWKPIFADDPFQLPAFRPLHQGLLRLPAHAAETEGWLSAAIDGAQPLSSAILSAAARQGHAVDGCYDPAELAGAAASTTPLADAIALLAEAEGDAVPLEELRTRTAGVPIELQRALVPVLGAIVHAGRELAAAFGTTDPERLDWLASVHGFVIAPQSAFAVDAERLGWLNAVDAARIARAAAIVARAVEDAELERFAGVELETLAVETPFGAVAIGGPGADSYEPGALAERSALLLDVGGDDSYRVPAGAGRPSLPVSVAIDLGGQDLYAYVEAPAALDLPTRLASDSEGRSGTWGSVGQSRSRTGRQGSGVLGIGMLFDFGVEDDEYRSLALSQGSGTLGVGALFDAGGNDLYAAEAMSQGAAAFGIGVLVDRSGADEYRTFTSSQGFGYVRGVGILADGGGDDVYFADPGDPAVGGDPLYPSAQLPGTGNTSFVQGAGFGRRDDAKGHDMGGGFGVLYDRAGADRYTASVFAQGSGYWLGFGMLIDGAGNDVYEGLWYVQGASAHFALGFALDRDGDDRYNEGFPIRATSIGVGHDFSGALQIDLGGSDRYFAPGLSLGCGNSQGAGGLINVGGDDLYEPAGGNTYGCASLGHGGPYDQVRDVRPTIGLFVDAGGSDTYAAPAGAPAASDDASWSFPVFFGTAGAPDSERSGGVDRGSKSVSLP
jgi:hypothetical protein